METTFTQTSPNTFNSFLQKDLDLLSCVKTINLTVDHGHLRVKTLGELIVSLFSHKFEQAIQEWVHQVITANIQHTENLNKFITSISKLGNNYFNRARLAEIQVPGCKDIQEYLSPAILELRQQKQLNPDLSRNRDHTIKRKAAKALFALSLGIIPCKASKGNSDPRVLKDYKGKPLGIIKPIKTTTPWYRKIGNLIKELLGFRRQIHLLRNGGALPEIYSDIATSVTDSFFGFHIVPHTKRLFLTDKVEGSFMVWCKKAIEAGEFLPSSDPTDAEIEMFHRFILLDFLIGNLDRHEENWLVQGSNGHMQHIWAIDNSNAFPDTHPTQEFCDIGVRYKQYQWREHPYATHSQPFSAELRTFMRSITRETIHILIDAMRQEFIRSDLDLGDAFLSDTMVTRLQERAAIIRALADDPSSNPLTLASTAHKKPFTLSYNHFVRQIAGKLHRP